MVDRHPVFLVCRGFGREEVRDGIGCEVIVVLFSEVEECRDNDDCGVVGLRSRCNVAEVTERTRREYE